MNLTTASPREIDTRIAEISNAIASLNNAMHRLIGTVKNEFVAPAARDRAQAEFDEKGARVDALHAELLALNAEFGRRGGWTRFYLVDNNNGHLHTTRHCSTTYATTSWYWMVDMSGLTKAEAVELGGKLTCLACFGEFRTEIEAGREPRIETPRGRKTREEREALAAAKAAKAGDKAAKAIANPDGTPLRVVECGAFGKLRDGSEVKTIIAAQRAASSAAYDLAWYNTVVDGGRGDHPDTPAWKATFERLTAALAVRLDRDVETLRTEITAKATKRAEKDAR